MDKPDLNKYDLGNFTLDKSASFESERVIYHGITECDTDILVRWRSMPENFKYFQNPTPLTAKRHLEWFKTYLNDPDRLDFIASIKTTGQKIGTAGLKHCGGGVWEVSNMVGEHEHKGKGYGTEILEGLCLYAAETFGAVSLKAVIHSNNLPSIRMTENLDFVLRNSISDNFDEYFKIILVKLKQDACHPKI